ncbi:Uncharacterized protein TCM_008228 [Theobroma cacao]|uniref:Uncharacterized protein n=1 Tax=Theobroma cacao TaxID=3641 RepID=A0A061EB58_THECC|nr:Uncharacterized protein TCM_008228 [Theobroma cacao]
MNLECHHKFTSPARYFKAIATFSSSDFVRTARKYCSISKRKFSNSLAFLTLSYRLSSITLAFFPRSLGLPLALPAVITKRFT